MKRIVAAISFILIFFMILSASVIPAGAITLDGNDNGEWKEYPIVKMFNEDSVIDGGFVKAAKETGKDSETTINFLIYAAFKKKGDKPEDPGIVFSFEDNGISEVYTSEGTERQTKSNNQNYKIVVVNKYYIDGSYYCEMQVEDKDGLDDTVDLKVEFRQKPFDEDETHKFRDPYSVEVSFNPEEATKTTAPKSTAGKATTEKPSKEKTTKTTTEKSTTTKPEKTTTAKPATTVTTEISHRTRRTTTAKSTAEITNEKAAKLKTTKQKTTKAKKTTSKAEKTLSERYYSSQAAEITTIVTSAETQTEPTSAAGAASETDKSLFGGEKLSKSSLYKLITGAVALVLFAIIGVSAVRTKSAADKAEEKPFSEKQKEEEKEDKKE